MAERVQVSSVAQLNALVAERVMGWQWYDAMGQPTLLPSAVGPQWVGALPERRNVAHVPDFVGSIADAWSVVERVMRVKQCHWSGGLSARGRAHNYFCGHADAARNYGVADTHGRADAATLPAAICLAALAAHGIDVELTGELA